MRDRLIAPGISSGAGDQDVALLPSSSFRLAKVTAPNLLKSVIYMYWLVPVLSLVVAVSSTRVHVLAGIAFVPKVANEFTAFSAINLKVA